MLAFISFKIICPRIYWVYGPVLYFSTLDFSVSDQHVDTLNGLRVSGIIVPAFPTCTDSQRCDCPTCRCCLLWLFYLSQLSFFYYPHDQGNPRGLKATYAVISVLLFSLSRILFKTVNEGKRDCNFQKQIKMWTLNLSKLLPSSVNK